MDVPLSYQDENQQRDTTPLPDLPPPPVTAPTPSTSRFGRLLKQPLRYGTEANIHQEAERHPSPTPPPQIPLHSPTPPVELETFRTQEDEFGRFRIYHQHPTLELSNTPPPDHNDFAGSGEIPETHPEDLASGLRMPVAFIAGLSGLMDLFVNTTVALLIQWFYSGTGQKSTADVQHLIDDVILHEDFKAKDLQGVKLATELKKLDTFESSLEGQGWNHCNVKISVPCPKEKVPELDAAEFEVEGLIYRDLIAVIQSACEDEMTADSFHTTPFEERWRPSDDAPPIRLYGEAYTSDEMIQAYEEVQKIPPDPKYPNAEHIVVELAPYSDGTMLAQFGTAFLWPVYIYFGNLSKYIRCQPSSHAAHHTAYFPSVSFILHHINYWSFSNQVTQLPDSFSDWYQEIFEIVPSEATITHCKRELIQALWLVMLSDPKFIQAYQFGIFICFSDQIIRRVFPRFFAYMADYPEK